MHGEQASSHGRAAQVHAQRRYNFNGCRDERSDDDPRQTASGRAGRPAARRRRELGRAGRARPRGDPSAATCSRSASGRFRIPCTRPVTSFSRRRGSSFTPSIGGLTSISTSPSPTCPSSRPRCSSPRARTWATSRAGMKSPRPTSASCSRASSPPSSSRACGCWSPSFPQPGSIRPNTG